MKYTVNNNQVFAGKKMIAQLYPNGTLKGNNELRILQGMNRQETINKIVNDCPNFCREYEITKDYYPRLF